MTFKLFIYLLRLTLQECQLFDALIIQFAYIYINTLNFLLISAHKNVFRNISELFEFCQFWSSQIIESLEFRFWRIKKITPKLTFKA